MLAKIRMIFACKASPITYKSKPSNWCLPPRLMLTHMHDLHLIDITMRHFFVSDRLSFPLTENMKAP